MRIDRTVIRAGLVVLLAAGLVAAILAIHVIGNLIALAGGELAVARHHAAPMDLTDTISRYGWQVENSGDDTRFNPWWTIPNGFQVFHHVPFQIDGAFPLWGESCAKKLHANFPEHIPDLSVNQKFETLYLLDCCFYIEPNRTPVYEVVFHYEDGLTATNQLAYGSDVLDWVANRRGRIVGPTAPNSKLAWVGGTWSPKTTIPIRLCMTAIKNPMPSIKVTSIDLNSCKSTSAGCILGLTTGKSGLMR